jgi:hypothetical protein
VGLPPAADPRHTRQATFDSEWMPQPPHFIVPLENDLQTSERSCRRPCHPPAIPYTIPLTTLCFFGGILDSNYSHFTRALHGSTKPNYASLCVLWILAFDSCKCLLLDTSNKLSNEI